MSDSSEEQLEDGPVSSVEQEPGLQGNHAPREKPARRARQARQLPQISKSAQTRQARETHEPKPHRKQASQFRRYEAYWAGPTPPPAILKQYNDALPEGAERIVAMLERQEEHRISEEEKDGEHVRAMERGSLALTTARVQGELRITGRSQVFGLLILLAVILPGGAGLILGILNHEGVAAIVGGLLSGGGLATLAGIFFPQLLRIGSPSQQEDVTALVPRQRRGADEAGQVKN